MRIHEYAKSLDVTSKEVLAEIRRFSQVQLTASSSLAKDYVEELNKVFVKEASPIEEKEVIRPMLQLEPTYKLDVQASIPKLWVVVGCGGNGAYLIPNLLRQISIQNKRLELAGTQSHKVVLIDADIVEEKNLTRQNFVRTDVGRNKAEVMATRYGRAFGLEIDFIPEYIETSEQLIGIVNRYKKGNVHSPVFIGAVDNNKTRVLINGAFVHFQQSFWIDAGNEEWGGQVVCGFNYHNQAPTKGRKEPHLFHLPSVIELYPEVGNAQDKLPTELSCAEHAVSSPQNIFTNMTASNLLMGFANTILTAQVRDGVGLKQHSVAFNSETMSYTTRLNTLKLLTPAPAPQEPVAEAPKEEVLQVEVEAKKEEVEA